MPTNLPPQYAKVEERYRAATETREKIEALEEMLSIIPKHKGTDKLRADLRRKLSKLKDSSQSKKSGSRHESSFNISPEGAGQVALIGGANTGKSSLLAALTNAAPEISPAPFTTWEAMPGMMPIDNIQVQLIDTPPLDAEYVSPELIDLIRRCDLALLVVDLHGEPFEQIERTLARLAQGRIYPAMHVERVEAEPRNRFIPIMLVINKVDDERHDADLEVFLELLEEDWPAAAVSAQTARNFDLLQEQIFASLGVIRVYAKPPGQEADHSQPFVLERGATVEEFAGRVHKDFIDNLKSARVWGSAAFDGQQVSRDYVLSDGDVVELRI